MTARRHRRLELTRKVNGLNQYTDSTGKPFTGPKMETIFEMARRVHSQHVGIVSKAYLADATPAAVCTHTSQRSQYYAIVEQYLTVRSLLVSTRSTVRASRPRTALGSVLCSATI